MIGGQICNNVHRRLGTGGADGLCRGGGGVRPGMRKGHKSLRRMSCSKLWGGVGGWEEWPLLEVNSERGLVLWVGNHSPEVILQLFWYISIKVF